MTEGWLLDLYASGDEVVIWIKTRGGGARSFRFRYPPSFYVAASRERMEHLRGDMEDWGMEIRTEYEWKRTDIRDYDPSRVLRVEVGSRAFYDIVSRLPVLEGMGYRFFNVDIPRIQKFLYHRDVFPMGLVRVRRGEIESLDDRFSVEYEVPPLRCLMAEVRPRTSIDAAIEAIAFDVDGKERFEVDGRGEEERILGAVDAIDGIDPDVVYISSRDLSHVSKRARARGVEHELRLGRDKTRVLSTGKRGRSFFSYGTVYYKEPQQPLYGRLRLDPGNSFIYESSGGLVTAGGPGSDEPGGGDPRSEFDLLHEVSPGEVFGPVDIHAGMNGLIEIARLTKIPVQKTSSTSPGTGISSMQLDQAYRDGLLIPWRKQEPEAFKSAMHLLESDRGGFIYEPSTGFHTRVGEIDFASMYPNIMERHNISPETVLCDCCRGDGDAPRVPTCGYHVCRRRKGIIPKVLKPLLEHRAHYKRLAKVGGRGAVRYDVRQRAIKWLLVCCFGYLGYKNARFGRVEAHQAVTSFGRDKLFRAVDVAEALGYEVLHGITDSLWLRKPGVGEEDYLELCRMVEERSGLSISLEGIYRWIVFVPSKMYPGVPVLNRYFGVFESGEIKVRGIELRRSDTPNVVKRAQWDMLQVLSSAVGREGYLDRLGRCLEIIRGYGDALREGRVDVRDLVISRRASKAPWEYSNLSHIAVSSLKLHRAGRTVQPGQFVGYVITKASAENPWERAEPIEFFEEDSRYDWRKYYDEVIRAGASLFEGLGYTHEAMRHMVADGRHQAALVCPGG